jgi:uncharacterized membrane protein YfcA
MPLTPTPRVCYNRATATRRSVSELENIDLWFYAGLAAAGFGAGLVGALLGLGGGIFLVPVLTLLMGLPPQAAAGTSLVAVIATSTAGASTYVRTRLANIRLAMLLAPATVAAAVVASWVAQALPRGVLLGLFALLLVYAAVSMVRPSRARAAAEAGLDDAVALAPDPWRLAGSYEDRAVGRTVRYRVRRLRDGFLASLLGGTVSGLLGVGGGIIQVPVMNLLMGVPLKVATGTSNFLLGITATASALIYYANGRINPLYAVPVALSVFAGARVGALLVQRLQSRVLRWIFAVVALLVALRMLLEALP